MRHSRSAGGATTARSTAETIVETWSASALCERHGGVTGKVRKDASTTVIASARGVRDARRAWGIWVPET
jgi:hypothetical protein